MTEFTSKNNGIWAEESRRSSRSSTSSSGSSAVTELPSVRALASRFNALASPESTIISGPARRPLSTSGLPRTSSPATVTSKEAPDVAQTTSTKTGKPQTNSTKTTPTVVAVTEKKPPLKPEPANDNDDDEVFVQATVTDRPEPVENFIKKTDSASSKTRAPPSRTPDKKWSSLSDIHSAHAEQTVPWQRTSSTPVNKSSRIIFGVPLRSVANISWGVTQARKPTVDEDESSSSDESTPSSPDDKGEAAVTNFGTFPRSRHTDNNLVKKSAAGGVKGKISQKLSNKQDVKYHSHSDLTMAGDDVGTTWRRKSVSDDLYVAPHQPLTRRQSISDLLKLYRTKSQTDLSQTDLSQTGDLKQPTSPNADAFHRPSAQVSTPLTMYDVKITPMQKPNVSPYKAPVKDIVRIPPGSISFKAKTSSSVFATPSGPFVPSTPSPSTSVPQTPKEPSSLSSSNVAVNTTSRTTVETTLDKTESQSSSSDSEDNEEPIRPKFTYQPPPKHFNRPTTQHPPSIDRHKPAITQKTGQKSKDEVGISSINSAYLPVSYRKLDEPSPKKPTAIANFRRVSSSSSDHEHVVDPPSSDENESKVADKYVSPVQSLVRSLNQNKDKPLYPNKPDILKPKPQDPIWLEKITPLDQVVTQSKAKPGNLVVTLEAKPGTVSLNGGKQILHKKLSKDSSASSDDDVDGVPHDDKGGSFIVSKPATLPIPKKRTQLTKPSVPPPKVPVDTKVETPRVGKLSARDSVDSWIKEVNEKISSASESSDSESEKPSDRSGYYNFNTDGLGETKKSVIPVTRAMEKQNSDKSVVLITNKTIESDPPVSHGSNETDTQTGQSSQVFDAQVKGESLHSVVSTRKIAHAFGGKLQRSREGEKDGDLKNAKNKSTPVQNDLPHTNEKVTSIVKENPILENSTERTSKIPTLKKDTPDGVKTQDIKANSQNSKDGPSITASRNKAPESPSSRKDKAGGGTEFQEKPSKGSFESQTNSSGSNSPGESFKEIDPYAIGRMIVRGARKNNSVVKKPENLTNIRNATVPANSPFSPLKSYSGMETTYNSKDPAMNKFRRASSSSDDQDLKGFRAGRIDSSSDEQSPRTGKRNKTSARRSSASSDAKTSDDEFNKRKSNGVFEAKLAKTV
ncbi:flocculation protein FLO11-like isoform X2 [Hyalella azteca]|uniref:Flocculation protein FLO11-like isoform X1 n=1 Tax=Hyalella azteca TaxID=294128 RepID=A0A8B7P7D4_HYAAZ|nr:flocculation protein FLO11-like isoform X1 [Hyalella azteca]XP_047738586.1 flocculation protein FLO11-like isoform X2 [Hyalella azteca]